MSEATSQPERFSAKIKIRNCGNRPRVVWIEPLPEDFTLLPGEEFEIVASNPDRVPDFHLLEYDGPTISATQVCPDTVDTDDCEVFKDGIKLESGHNRQVAIDAGLDM